MSSDWIRRVTGSAFEPLHAKFGGFQLLDALRLPRSRFRTLMGLERSGVWQMSGSGQLMPHLIFGVAAILSTYVGSVCCVT